MQAALEALGYRVVDLGIVDDECVLTSFREYFGLTFEKAYMHMSRS